MVIKEISISYLMQKLLNNTLQLNVQEFASFLYQLSK